MGPLSGREVGRSECLLLMPLWGLHVSIDLACMSSGILVLLQMVYYNIFSGLRDLGEPLYFPHFQIVRYGVLQGKDHTA